MHRPGGHHFQDLLSAMEDLTTVINTADIYNPESFTSYHLITIMVKMAVKQVSETIFSAHQIYLASRQ